MIHYLIGDNRATLPTIAAGSVHCVVTSPPYFGLRDYGVAGQLGNEGTVDEFVENLVGVFREVRRTLRDDGTLWLNLGDSYASGKDLLGIPWRVAFALQADGWTLRQDIIWHKPSPMPESVRDRCTKAHEYLFLLAKSPRYFYDADAVAEASVDPGVRSYQATGTKDASARSSPQMRTRVAGSCGAGATRNRRSVWKIASQPFKGAHFATFPQRLVEPCILAGTSARGACPTCGAPWSRVTTRTKLTRERPNDHVKVDGSHGNSCANSVAGVAVATIGWAASCKCSPAEPVPCVVLDPFGGAGTVGLVAQRLGRDAILCELNPSYAELSRERIEKERLPLHG